MWGEALNSSRQRKVAEEIEDDLVSWKSLDINHDMDFFITSSPPQAQAQQFEQIHQVSLRSLRLEEFVEENTSLMSGKLIINGFLFIYFLRMI
jgi:hypothetical protein